MNVYYLLLCIIIFILRLDPARKCSFLVFLGHVAHGDHNFVPNEAPNWYCTLHSVYTRVPLITRIWAPGNRFWPRGWAPGAPLGRSIAMMEEGWHHDFSIEFFSKTSHYEHNTIPYATICRKWALTTLGGDIGAPHTRIWGLWDPYGPR